MNKLKAKMIYKIKKNVALKGKIKILLMILQFPVVFGAFLGSKLYFHNRKIWLIGETGIDAKDNGLAFFSYLKKNHKEIDTVYYITGDSKAADTVKELGDVVKTNSFRNKMAFMASIYILSTHDGYSIPFKGVNWREFKIVFGWLVPDLQFVFLSHGVNKDDTTENANYNRTKFDFHVTSTEAEFKEMSDERYKYPKGNIIKTGFARYDILQNEKNIYKAKRNILYMPTWRYYLADVSDHDFVKSDYFLKMYSFMHNVNLNKILSDNNVDFYFFPPHHEIQKRIHLFNLEETEIMTFNTEEDKFSKILLESAMMITDFSSVVFDFAYLYKRTAYYQFDLKKYRQGHYKEGYFKYESDGFGPILYEEDKIIAEIEKAIDNNFVIDEYYEKRIRNTFSVTDNKNSERLYKILKK